MKKSLITLAILATMLTTSVYAQTTSGISSTTCTQVSNTIVCTNTTTLTIPGSINLTGMTLPREGSVPPPPPPPPPPYVPPAPTPVPPGTPVDNCVSEPVRIIVNASQAYNRFYTTDFSPSFKSGENFVIALDVGTTDTTVGRQMATFGFADYGASRGGRYVTISKTKCDYSDNAQWVSANFYGNKTPANGAAASVGIGGDPRSTDIKLTPGRWYINMKNISCPAGISCSAVVQWSN